MFPSLVNCCTIDWFSNWPGEALESVGRGAVGVNANGESLELGKDEDACVEVFKVIHQSVEEITEEYKDAMRRHNYVTPTSYLELLNAYKKILADKRNEVGKAKQRLQKGLKVLKEAAIEVEKLQDTMTKNQPILEKTRVEVAETAKVIAKQTAEADEVKAVVVVEEAEAAKQAAEVKAIKDNADEKLNEALPALDSAVRQVKQINPNDFVEMRQVRKPTATIVTAFKVLCMFLVET